MRKLLDNAQELIIMAQDLSAAGYRDEALAFALAAAQRIQLSKLFGNEISNSP